MTLLIPAYKILLKIITEKVMFRKAIKAILALPEFEKLGPDGTIKVKNLVGCVLRHYLVFEHVSKKFNPDVKESQIIAIGLALANSLFIKVLVDEKTIKFVREKFEEDDIAFDENKFSELLKAKENNEPLIDESLKKEPEKFISLRYNLPVDVVKGLINNYGLKNTTKIAASLNKVPKQYLRVNTLKTNKEEIISKAPNLFEETSINPDLLSFKVNIPAMHNKYEKAGEVYQMPLAMKFFMDELPIESFKTMAIYCYDFNFVPLELTVKYDNKIDYDLLVEPQRDYYQFKKINYRYGVKGCHISETKVGNFISSISNKVSCFMVFPESSGYYRFRLNPDYFNTFDFNKLDSILKHQNACLNDAAKAVEQGGYLIYGVRTINKKETANMIRQFIVKNKGDFILVNQHTYFPSDEENSVFYYAILQRM